MFPIFKQRTGYVGDRNREWEGKKVEHYGEILPYHPQKRRDLTEMLSIITEPLQVNEDVLMEANYSW